MSDLRESGTLEQDTDMVIFINRPETYGIEKFPDGNLTENIAEITIAKARNSPPGNFQLFFQKSCTSFRNIFVDAEGNTRPETAAPPELELINTELPF